jgi:hypothetical protein
MENKNTNIFSERRRRRRRKTATNTSATQLTMPDCEKSWSPFSPPIPT